MVESWRAVVLRTAVEDEEVVDARVVRNERTVDADEEVETGRVDAWMVGWVITYDEWINGVNTGYKYDYIYEYPYRVDPIHIGDDNEHTEEIDETF